MKKHIVSIELNQYLYQQGSLFPYEPKGLDEIVFPSIKSTGVPELNSNMIADDIKVPFKIWGDSSRKNVMTGTYGFYTDDYKFKGLWNNPDKLIKSCCQVAIEPNFSVRPRMPFPVALYEIFRKRWLSCYWQSQGVKIIIDMNVAWPYLALNLLGVPKGTRSYATRAHKGEHDLIEKVYTLCQHHAETEDIFFLVYGGGKGIEGLCQRHEWTWQPEKMHTQRRKKKREHYEKAQCTLKEYTSGL